jgi:hypothetical protein
MVLGMLRENAPLDVLTNLVVAGEDLAAAGIGTKQAVAELVELPLRFAK